MIVITGSDGIVGRALCHSMLTKAMAFLPITHRRKIHTLPYALEVNLAKTLQPLVPYLNKITTVVHLAAAVPHSTDYPDDDVSAAITRSIDQNILALQEKTGAHVIYMSTCGLYDRNSIVEKTELSPIKIASPYFAAKARGEELFRSAGNCTIFRLAAPIGRGIKPKVVLSRFIWAARNNMPIWVWGSGKREQNYIDCTDVSDLIIKASQNPIQEIFNVASSSSTTMLELAEIVVSVLGRGTIELASKPDPCDGETARYSIERALNRYAWSPRVSLSEAIANIASDEFILNS